MTIRIARSRELTRSTSLENVEYIQRRLPHGMGVTRLTDCPPNGRASTKCSILVSANSGLRCRESCRRVLGRVLARIWAGRGAGYAAVRLRWRWREKYSFVPR